VGNAHPTKQYFSKKADKMNQSTIKLQIPFESLVEVIPNLDIEQKQQLWKILDEEMAVIEDDLEETNSQIQSEIIAARKAYDTGEYMTLEEYVADNN
jgi:hypothetical protein